MQDGKPVEREPEEARPLRRPWIEPSFTVVPIGETANGGVAGINDGITAES